MLQYWLIIVYIVTRVLIAKMKHYILFPMVCELKCSDTQIKKALEQTAHVPVKWQLNELLFRYLLVFNVAQSQCKGTLQT